MENYSEVIKVKAEREYNEGEFPKLMTVMARAAEDDGDELFQAQYYNHLLAMMREPSFCGIVAGINNEALYVVGEYDEMAIVLDPHYVQT